MISFEFDFSKGIRYKGRIILQHFSEIFETTSKFVIAFVRLILGKVQVDGFTGAQQKTDTRYEFGLKIILKGLGCKLRFLQLFLIDFPSNK